MQKIQLSAKKRKAKDISLVGIFQQATGRKRVLWDRMMTERVSDKVMSFEKKNRVPEMKVKRDESKEE